MRKTLLYLIMGIFACVANVHAEKTFTATGANSLGTGMSPNGKYVVGVSSQYFAYNIYMKSYLYNVETGSMEWITDYDEADYGKSGSFADVSNDGVISGTFKDPEYTITVSDFDGDRTFPINVAAVWKDGIRTSLGFGSYELSQFNYFEDGSFANAISGDGKTVVGNIGIGNSTYMFPCKWEQADSGAWTFSQLNLPQNAVGGKAVDVSTDGSIITGVIWFPMYEAAAYWQNGECHLIEGVGEDVQYNGTGQNKACAVSPNGRFVGFIFGNSEPGVYDVLQKSYKKIIPFEPYHSPDDLAVADNGNAVSSFGYGSFFTGEIYERPFWYSYEEDRILGFDYFMSLFAQGVKPSFTFAYEEKTKVTPCAISADGTFIMGNNDVVVAMGGVPECWMLQTEYRMVKIPATPEGLQAKSQKFKEVTLTWNKDEQVYDGLELESYNVYCGGEKIDNVAADVLELTYRHRNATPGFPEYSIASVFQAADASKVESPKSNPVAVAVPDTYELPFFDDFDSQSLETNYWTKEPYYGDMIDNTWGVIPYYGIYDYGLYSSPTTQAPYSSGLISRPMDAKNEKHVTLSFVIIYGLINSDNQQMDKDSLSIDVSSDKGVNWEEVKGMSFKDLPQSNWSMQTVDLSKWVAGKLFQVRLRKHGQGVAQYYYSIDLFKVGTTPEKDAPEGLTGQITDARQVNLIWKNSFGAYQLNHINEYYSMGLAVGNEGKEFIAANSFDTTDLAVYKGKYITSVSAFINHSYIEDSKDTHASIVIFEDGKLIREQQMEDIKYNDYNTVLLDEPIPVDGQKELKVGLKIFDYDERQIPIAYQTTSKFLPGKSDLYSEDGGKTWQKLSDYYAAIEGQEQSGYCSWDITANITDESISSTTDMNPDNNMLAYNVFRNGEKISNQLLDKRQSRFTDTEAMDDCYYEVVAYYFDGSVSDVSDRFTIGKLSSIRNLDSNNGIRIYPNPVTDRINITGEFVKATLLNINGQVVTATSENVIPVSSFPAGVYFLKIESGDKVQTEKIMIEK